MKKYDDGYNRECLIDRHTLFCEKGFPVEIAAYGVYNTATWIEDQLLEAGAEPGKDYTILDCFKLAMEQHRINAIEKLASIMDSNQIAPAIYDLSGELRRISDKMVF